MNFTQWKKYADKKSISKITYCCGIVTLTEIVLQDIKKILDVNQYTELSANSNFWESASQYSMETGNFLVVVRQAEKITNWQYLENWLRAAKSHSGSYIVFLSGDDDAPSIYTKGKRIGYAEHIEIIRTKGKFIKCSQPNEDDLLIWCLSFGLTKSSSQYLIERTAGNVAEMYDVFKKIHLWNGSPAPKAIELLCDELSNESLVDNLITKNKNAAYLSLATMSDYDKSRAITQLEYRLDILNEISKHVRNRVWVNDIAQKTGIKIYWVKKLAPLVKDYDEKTIKQRRQLLAMLDSVQTHNAKLEMLIGLW